MFTLISKRAFLTSGNIPLFFNKYNKILFSSFAKFTGQIHYLNQIKNNSNLNFDGINFSNLINKNIETALSLKSKSFTNIIIAILSSQSNLISLNVLLNLICVKTGKLKKLLL